MEFVGQIGIELEGAWIKERELARKNPASMKNDGSLNFKTQKRIPESCLLVGEKASPAFDNLNHLHDWLMREYPHEANRTSGFHIHVSLKNRSDYYFVRNAIFHARFIEEVTKFGNKMRLGKQFFLRLRKDSPYSSTSYSVSRRYSALNYTAYDEHGTTEIRLFPMLMPKEKAFKCVQFVVDFFENNVKILKEEARIKKLAEEEKKNEMQKIRANIAALTEGKTLEEKVAIYKLAGYTIHANTSGGVKHYFYQGIAGWSPIL